MTMVPTGLTTLGGMVRCVCRLSIRGGGRGGEQGEGIPPENVGLLSLAKNALEGRKQAGEAPGTHVSGSCLATHI